MLGTEDLFTIAPFSLTKEEKRQRIIEEISKLTRHHYESCIDYTRILDLLEFDSRQLQKIEQLPFLPVRLFKEFELLSIPREQISNTMTSSGTSGQGVSRIFLDHTTAMLQKKVLHKLVSDFTGGKRHPMLIIDSRESLRRHSDFSARGAGILGFSILGYDHTYAFNDRMELDQNIVNAFLDKYSNSEILLFGFTSIVWEYFVHSLTRKGEKFSIERGTLIHGGGWKKLIDQSIDNSTFKHRLREVCGIKKVHNYYGMVEQTGSIFIECDLGNLHCSNFSDVLIRQRDLSVCKYGEAGLVQLISVLPLSYPGHSILSEDMGIITGEDDCLCGRMGKTIHIYGRAKAAEVRGCSDTYPT